MYLPQIAFLSAFEQLVEELGLAQGARGAHINIYKSAGSSHVSLSLTMGLKTKSSCSMRLITTPQLACLEATRLIRPSRDDKDQTVRHVPATKCLLQSADSLNACKTTRHSLLSRIAQK